MPASGTAANVFDHVSTLKLIETLFLGGSGLLEGLHVSPWRYHTVGDMTGALPTVKAPDPVVPHLPPTSLLFPQTATESLLDALAGMGDSAPAYPPPGSNSTDYLRSDPDSITRRRAHA